MIIILFIYFFLLQTDIEADDEVPSQDETTDPLVEDENQTNDPEITHQTPEKPVVSALKRTCPSNEKKGTKQKIPRENKIDEAFDMLKSVAAKQTLDDANADYGKHVANKLRNYSERVKAIVQYNINNILFQADMGYFNRNQNFSVPVIPTTTPVPTPSPQETSQSYTDLSSPLGYQETSNENAASFLGQWQEH